MKQKTFISILAVCCVMMSCQKHEEISTPAKKVILGYEVSAETKSVEDGILNALNSRLPKKISITLTSQYGVKYSGYTGEVLEVPAGKYVCSGRYYNSVNRVVFDGVKAWAVDRPVIQITDTITISSSGYNTVKGYYDCFAVVMSTKEATGVKVLGYNLPVYTSGNYCCTFIRTYSLTKSYMFVTIPVKGVKARKYNIRVGSEGKNAVKNGVYYLLTPAGEDNSDLQSYQFGYGLDDWKAGQLDETYTTIAGSTGSDEGIALYGDEDIADKDSGKKDGYGQQELSIGSNSSDEGECRF